MTQTRHPDPGLPAALRRNWPAIVFLSPAAIVLLVFMAIPMANSIVLSFQSWNGMSAPVWVGLRNYRALFGDRLFLIALGNTAYFTIVTVILQTTLPLLVACLLNAGIRGGVLFRTLYFMPVIISLAISGLLWAMIYEPNFGVLNEFLRSIGLGGLTQLWLADRRTVMPSIIAVSIWQSLGFYLVIYYAAMQNIPGELYDAAKIDSANALQRLWHVTVPMLRPVIVLVVVLNTINGIKVFDQIWVMTAGGPNHASDTLGTYLYSTSFGAMGSSNPQLGYATSIAIVILVLSFILSIVQIRLGRRQEIEY
ncbi:carbohydrate ABC transporter permease [Labrys wisconsinensis]|uniref:ABC-type sugar transport system permease subunit n=1 Tax=Labrys wisconsinensis TaxID=425677 RepID=A0ABU0JKC9_9HYPH|nr:sugar ABC transporter permease [Labrys wisconsinensis]MDQ0474740.1 ABC-type sugar transport system permease subunit [Labrys wisconsinensis]